MIRLAMVVTGDILSFGKQGFIFENSLTFVRKSRKGTKTLIFTSNNKWAEVELPKPFKEYTSSKYVKNYDDLRKLSKGEDVVYIQKDGTPIVPLKMKDEFLFKRRIVKDSPKKYSGVIKIQE